MSNKPVSRTASLSPEQLRAAISQLDRRIAEVEALTPSSVLGDQSYREAGLKIDDTLVSIFGADSIEYNRYQVGSLVRIAVSRVRPTPPSRISAAYQNGKARALTTLRTIRDLFLEKLDDFGKSSVGITTRDIASLNLHSEIERASAELFQNGHYANAIEDACKALDGLVKMRSQRFDLNGTDLMTTVFSAKAPILKFNNGESESDHSERQGMMFLLAGAMLAFRNPRAHRLVTDESENALSILSFVSFLAKSVDRAKR